MEDKPFWQRYLINFGVLLVLVFILGLFLLLGAGSYMLLVGWLGETLAAIISAGFGSLSFFAWIMSIDTGDYPR